MTAVGSDLARLSFGVTAVGSDLTRVIKKVSAVGKRVGEVGAEQTAVSKNRTRVGSGQTAVGDQLQASNWAHVPSEKKDRNSVQLLLPRYCIAWYLNEATQSCGNWGFLSLKHSFQ